MLSDLIESYGIGDRVEGKVKIGRFTWESIATNDIYFEDNEN